MLWDIWKRWLASKGLPLVGAALLQEKDRREPQWKHLQVKYLASLGKHGLEESWEQQCPGDPRSAPGPGLGWDLLIPNELAVLELERLAKT